MNIAIDFDDTITADTKMFVALISNMQNFGHTVYIVTARKPTSKNTDIEQFCRRLKRPVQDVIYTSCQSKIAYTRALNIDINLWIDDCPEMVVHDVEEAQRIRHELRERTAIHVEPKQHTRTKPNPRGIRR